MRALVPASVTSTGCMHLCKRRGSCWTVSNLAHDTGGVDILSITRRFAPIQRRHFHSITIQCRQLSVTKRHSTTQKPSLPRSRTLSVQAGGGTFPARKYSHGLVRPSNESLQYSDPSTLATRRQFTETGYQHPSHFENLLQHADFETLRFESALGNERKFDRPRLTEVPLHTNNIPLWTELLEFRSRVDGAAGVSYVWTEMNLRSAEIPTRGEAAHRLWETAIGSALKDRDFLIKMIQDAERVAMAAGHTYECLYDRIIGHMLRTAPTEACQWHDALWFAARTPRNIGSIVHGALTSKVSLQSLRAICERTDAPRLHDQMITTLCERNDYGAAMSWHEFLMAQNNLPSSSSVLDPLRRHLILGGFEREVEDMTQKMVSAGVRFDSPVNIATPIPSPEQIVRKGMVESDGVNDNILSDERMARFFATQSFGLHLLMHTLRAFGSPRLGPLSTQQLALRCENTAAFKESLDFVSKTDNIIDQHPYSKALQTVAASGNETLFTALKESDMHPDVYFNVSLQKRLLRSYITQKLQFDVHRTLLILQSHAEVSYPNLNWTSAWNHLLRAYIYLGQPDRISQLVDDMLQLGHQVSKRLQDKLLEEIVHRNKAKKTNKRLAIDRMAGLDFLVTVWSRILKAGGEVSVLSWGELMTGYARHGHQGDQEHLCLFLASHYCAKPSGTESFLLKVIDGPQDPILKAESIRRHALHYSDVRHPIRILFDHATIRILVKESFKNLGRPSYLHSKLPLNSSDDYIQRAVQELNSVPLYARGLALVKLLHTEYGVPVDMAALSETVQNCLIPLFGKGRSNETVNRRARFNNKTSFPEMARYLHEMWDKKLFDLPDSVMYGENEGPRTALEAYLLKGAQATPEEGHQRVRWTLALEKQERVLKKRKYREEREASRSRQPVSIWAGPDLTSDKEADQSVSSSEHEEKTS